MKSNDLMALKVKKENAESIKKVEEELAKIIDSKAETDEKSVFSC